MKIFRKINIDLYEGPVLYIGYNVLHNLKVISD